MVSGKRQGQEQEADQLLYFLVYVLELVSGLFVYFFIDTGNKRLRMHAVQAVFLGIVTIAAGIFFSLILLPEIGSAVSFIIWIYCLYVGLEAYKGNDIHIPIISDYAK